jgi:transposase-like protein
MKRNSDPFKRRHHELTIILLCVRWYCRYAFSYRDLEKMVRKRGLAVDHTTVSGCVKTPPPFLHRITANTFNMR